MMWVGKRGWRLTSERDNKRVRRESFHQTSSPRNLMKQLDEGKVDYYPPAYLILASYTSVCFTRRHTQLSTFTFSPTLLVNLYFMRSKYSTFSCLMTTFSSLCPLVTSWTSTLSTGFPFQFQSLFSMTAITLMIISSQINVINDHCRVMSEGKRERERLTWCEGPWSFQKATGHKTNQHHSLFELVTRG